MNRPPWRFRASGLKHALLNFFKPALEDEEIILQREEDLVTVPLTICTNFLAFSFAPAGWHYLTALLAEYVSDPTITWKQSVLTKFYERYQPRDMAGLVADEVGYKSDFGVLPWGTFTGPDVTAKVPARSRACGPSDERLIEWEFWQAITIFRRISRNGYQPLRHRDGFIRGVFLERPNGDRRFVLTDGTHRGAALALLGASEILAQCEPGLPVIREAEVDRWTAVRTGACSPDDALRYFKAYFELNGRERAQGLGLLSSG